MEALTLSGRVVSGSGQGALFTQLPWAREAFLTLLGFDPFPGTLNLKLEDPEAVQHWKNLKMHPGYALIPPHRETCRARCYPVLVESRLTAAIVYPEVPDYPEDQLELIAPVSLRKSLSLKDSDRLELEVIEETRA